MTAHTSSRPSPSLLIATIALVVVLTGGAIAGAGAASKPLTKKVVKKIANKEITKRAPGLAVASAKSADAAKSADLAKVAEDAQKLGGVGQSGYLRYGAPIPSGATVKGVFGGAESAAANAFVEIRVSLPAPAPVALTSANVNFAPDANAATQDDDPACTGTLLQPTAPPGKVCIYAGSVGPGSSTGEGAGPVGGPTTLGFVVVANGTTGAVADGTWAYTAP